MILQRKFALCALVATGMAIFAHILPGCNKLDTTDLGNDLIPPVDNVKTFDTLLLVQTTQGFFNDSSKIAATQNIPVGTITAINDPLFGKTTSNLFFDLKPSAFPHYIGVQAKDTIVRIDSVVLCLAYRGTFGDSSASSKLDLRTINPSALAGSFNDTTLFPFSYRPSSFMGPVIGSSVVNIPNLKNWVVFTNKKDSVRNQIRIKITDSAFVRKLYRMDSANVIGNNAFRNDSLWKTFFRGFAVVTDSTFGPGGKVLLYTNLSDAATRLEIHFVRKNNGRTDSVFTSLPFLSTPAINSNRSAYAVNISHDWQGAEITSPAPNTAYIQTGPGTFATLRIPALDTLSNRIIHRAELVVEQVAGFPSVDPKLPAPAYLYIENLDTGNLFRPIPYDLFPDNGYSFFPGVANINFGYFGGFQREKSDAFGNRIAYYNFNISRYVQGIVTRKERNLPLRLHAPYLLDYTRQLGIFGLEYYRNAVAFGRIKVGDGNNNDYRLRLRLVYSRI